MKRHTTWRKSSYSGANNECVELCLGADSSAVRDSKSGSAGPVLSFDSAAFDAFLTAVKAGRVDR